MSSRVTRIWMWTEACERLDRAGALERAFFRPSENSVQGAVWEPPADIFESATEIYITVALPGVPADRVEIAERDGRVVVTSRRQLPKAEVAMAIRRLEIPYGRFERSFDLPAASTLLEKVLADGCLHLRFRKNVMKKT